MPKGYLPLGSQLASGSIGEMIPFQGESARSYFVPYDPRTDLQINTRHLFHDINRMLKAGGPWARAAWKTQWGSRWMAVLYGQARGNVSGYWDFADAIYEAF